MKFRDVEQRARVCRALLTTVFDKAAADALWTERGPTETAIAHCDNARSFAPAPRQAFRLAWEVWNGVVDFRIGIALEHWPANAWVVFADFINAVADDALFADGADNAPFDDGDTSLDAWVRSVEAEMGWASAEKIA